MKTISLIVSILVLPTSALLAAKASVEKLWETDPVLKVPESVLHDESRDILYVANIEGEKPWGKDGKGSIGKLSLKGEVIDAEWVKGLHAPKGMGVLGDRLYVTDVDQVVTISIEKGKIMDRVQVPDAGTINDLSVAADGTVYVTDSTKGIIYTLINGKLSKVIEGRKGLNGVLHSEGELLFADSGSLYLVKDDGSPKEIASGMEKSTDGIERVDDDSWLVSCWVGTLYHVTRDGEVTNLIDTRDSEINAADIGYNAAEKIVYVPTFWKDSVAAYQLKL